MKEFLSEDFLLNSKTSQKLYFDYASKQPIIDYHCHVSPKEIFENKRFNNLYEVWLSGDHYKWRIMRSNGVDEKYITGDAPQKEKFKKFAEALEKAIGNPMYHWCHLELKNYFGYNGVLNSKTADEVWELANKKLALENMSVKGIINKSNVSFIGTTDDPTDSLIWHKKIKEDKDFKVKVAPTFRPDKALNIEKPDFAEYINTLSSVSGIKINSLSSLKEALLNRMEYFNEVGCRASDHGLDYMVFKEAPQSKIEKILKKALNKKPISIEEAEAFKTELLCFCAKEYVNLGWVMQLHYNCLRNPNSKMFEKLGADTGFDCIARNNSTYSLSALFDKLFKNSALPKTIVYSLDATDNSFIDTLIGAFQTKEIAGKIQHGSAWWFNDNKMGMQEHLTSLANLSLLGNFVGMLTDSRSFLSYTRHEYFRRILCEFIGSLVENGEFPNDEEALEKIVKDICFYNAKKYFNI